MKAMERQAERTMAAIKGVGVAQDATAKKQAAAAAASEKQARALGVLEGKHQKVAANAEKHSRVLRGGTSDTRKATDAVTSHAAAHDDLGKSMDSSVASIGKVRRALRDLTADLGAFSRMQSRTSMGAGGGLDRKASGLIGDVMDISKNTSAVKDLSKAGKQVGEAFAVAGEGLKFLKDAAIPGAVYKAAAAISALGGGLVALVPELLQAAQGMQAIPGAAAVAAQAMFTIKAAMNGVGAAVSAGMQAQNQWSLNQRQWSEQVVQGQQAVKDAMHGVVDAANAQVVAQHGLMDAVYQQGVASHSLTEAIYAQGVAHHDLTEAIYTQTQAQISLTVARRDAMRTLQDMEFAASTAILKEARAGLDIQQAKQQLQQMMMTPGTTALQLQSGRLDVMDAVTNATQVHTQALRDQADARRAQRHDPTSAPTMQIAQAQHAMQVATYGVAQSQHESAQAAYAVKQAQHDLVESAFAVTQAQKGVADSAFNAARAQQSLKAAQFSLHTLMLQGNAGVSAYNQALRNLGPAQRAFVKFLVGPMGPTDKKSLIGQIQNLQNMAAKGLFPGMEKGIRGMTAVWGPLGKIIEATGRVLGNTIGRIMSVFTGPKGLSLMEGVGANNVKILGNLGDAFVSVAHTVRTMMVAAEPFLLWLSQVVKHLAALHDSNTNIKELGDKFTAAKHALELFGGILKNMWTIFKDVMKAATPLGEMLWGVKGKGGFGGASGGIAGFAMWTQKNGPAMKKWFTDLYPTLHAVGQLIKAIGVAFLGLGKNEGQKGATSLLASATRLVPIFAQFLHDLDALGPGLRIMFQVAGGILDSLAKVVTWVLKLPGIGNAIAVAFGAAFSVLIIGRFTAKLGSAIGLVRKGASAWNDWRRNKARALTDTGIKAGSSKLGADKEKLSASEMSLNDKYGVRSRGPGSMTNPLIVRIDSLGGSAPQGSAAQKLNQAGGDVRKVDAAASDASKAEAAAADVSKMGRLESLGLALGGSGALGGTAAKLLGGIPGLGKIGSGAAKAVGDVTQLAPGVAAGASDVASVAGKGSKILGVLGSAGELLGKVAGPLGIALTAIPAITTFLSAKGSFGSRLGQAGSAALSSATFGLVNVNNTTKAGQYAQGNARAATVFKGFSTGPNGLLDAKGTAQYHAHLAQVQQGYNVAANGTQTRFGVVGQDDAVRQRDFAQLKAMETAFARDQAATGATAGRTWQEAYGAAIDRGTKPKVAMTSLLGGLKMQMDKLGPDGQQSLLRSMTTWGAQIVAANPKLKGPVDDMNNYILNSFQGMGQGVAIVNGQIVTNSQSEWNSTYTAMTDPMDKALAKLNGTFNQIQQKAVGELQAMGLNKSDAQLLLKNPASAASWVKYYHSGGPATGSGVGHRNATGGRVMGGNKRDVYQFGGSMLGGGELVVNSHQEQEANARLMRHGEPTIGTIVSNRNTPNWFAKGGRAAGSRSNTGGYTDPIAGFTLGRTDMGLDANAPVGTPITAIGDSTLRGVIQNWYAGQPLLDFQLNSGPDTGRYWYVAEQITPVTEKIGSHFAAGQAVAHYAPSGTGIEIGWAANASGQTLAQGTGATGDSSHGNAPAGIAFTQFVQGLAHGKLVGGGPGGGVGGGMTAKPFKALRAPQISGLFGVPEVLAQRAANMYAQNLTAALQHGDTQYNKTAAATPAAAGGSNIGMGGVAPGSWTKVASELAAKHGWDATQLAAWRGVENVEDGSYSLTAQNPTSSAYGLAQFIQGASGYATYGGNSTTLVGQLTAMANYIAGRYGNPAGALAHERSFNWYSQGGRIADAGWNSRGGTFTTNGPTVFGAGEGGRKETVTITPAGASQRPINIRIDLIEVNRKGDVKKIVDEELRLLATELDRPR